MSDGLTTELEDGVYGTCPHGGDLTDGALTALADVWYELTNYNAGRYAEDYGNPPEYAANRLRMAEARAAGLLAAFGWLEKIAPGKRERERNERADNIFMYGKKD